MQGAERVSEFVALGEFGLGLAFEVQARCFALQLFLKKNLRIFLEDEEKFLPLQSRFERDGESKEDTFKKQFFDVI